MNRRSGDRSPRLCTPLTKDPSVPELGERDLAHARHETKVGHDVRAVGELDADAAVLRAWRAP